jgi:hypothetical protein
MLFFPTFLIKATEFISMYRVSLTFFPDPLMYRLVEIYRESYEHKTYQKTLSTTYL